MNSSAAMGYTAPHGAQEFEASWRSVTGGVLVMLIVSAAVLGSMAMIASSSAARIGAGSTAAFCALMAYFLGRNFIGSAPYLRFASDGVSGRALKGKTIAWSDIKRISLQTVQGHAQLHLDLALPPGQRAKRSFLTGLDSSKKIIVLGHIRKNDHPKVLDAANKAFIQYSPIKAAAALDVAIEEVRVAQVFEERLRTMTPRVWAMPALMTICVVV